MSEHGEGPKPGEQIIGGPEKPPQGTNPAYEQAANNASSTLNNHDLNPHINGPTLKQKIAGGLAALGIAFGGGVAASDKIQDVVGGAVDTASATTRDIAETGVNVVKTPFEVAKDGLDAITPDNGPEKPRNPDGVMVGSVSIETTDRLNVRTSPNIPGKESPGNEINWKDVKLVNQVVVDGRIQLVPVEFTPGDTIIVENPDIVDGQYSGGGFGHGESSNWVMLYTQNDKGELRAVYVAKQKETFPMVKNESENSRVIKAETVQDDPNGVKVIKFAEQVPTVRNQITVKHSEPQVAGQ